MSERLYNAIPDTLRPANRLQPTLPEQGKILRYAYFYARDFDPVQLDELDTIAAQLDRATKKNLKKQLLVESLFSLAVYTDAFIAREDKERCMPYYNRIIALAKADTAYHFYLVQALVVKGSYYEEMEEEEKAVDVYDEALDISMKAKDTMGIIKVYSQCFVPYLKLELYEQALAYQELGLKYALIKAAQDKSPQFWYFIRHITLVRSETLINWYARDRNKVHGDSAVALANALLYRDNGGLTLWHSNCYYVKGYRCFLDSNYRQALVFFDSSLFPPYLERSFDRMTDGRKSAYKALCLIKLGQRKEGLQMLRNNEDVGYVAELSADVYAVLSDDARRNGNWKDAFVYAQKARANQDSIHMLSYRGKIFEINQKYALAHKETQIKELENKSLTRGRQRDLAIFAVVTALLLLVVTALLFAVSSRRQQLKRLAAERAIETEREKREEELVLLEANMLLQQNEAVVAQRTKISEDMHDDLSGSLVALRYYIADVKERASGSEGTKKILDNIESEVATIHENARRYMHNLSNSVKSLQYNLVDFLWNFSEQISKKTSLKIHLDADKDEINTILTTEQHSQMYYLIKEAIANTIKYAAAEHIDIVIRFSDDRCLFSISDDGKGLDDENTITGLGLQSMRRRMELLNGQLAIESDSDGTKISGSFPVYR